MQNGRVLIQRGQNLGGVEVVELRRLLRLVRGAVFTPAGFADAIKAESHEAAPLFAVLESQGLIESGADPWDEPFLLGDDEDPDGDDIEWWRTSVAGNALAKARIGKPMSWLEGQRLLAGLVERARDVNDDPGELFIIESIELYGSLTRPSADTVGDVDVRVLVSHRFNGRAHVDELWRRRPGNPLAAAEAALRQLRRVLTGGSSRIDLQLDELPGQPLPDGATVDVVYRRDDDAHS